MSTSDYKKQLLIFFIILLLWELVLSCRCALIINNGLGKGKIAGKTELKFDMRDTRKLFVYLSAGEFIRQKRVDMGWIPASLMPK